MSQQHLRSSEFRVSMRHVASSVCVVTAGGDGGRVGITATSVCSVSMAPPLLLVCINVGSMSHDSLLHAGHFGVNVLDESQEQVADVFAGRHGLAGEARFLAAGALWEEGHGNAPLLAGAVASFGCRLVQRIPAGTHSVLIGEVVDVRCREAGNPLIYLDGSYGRFSVGSGCTA